MFIHKKLTYRFNGNKYDTRGYSDIDDFSNILLRNAFLKKSFIKDFGNLSEITVDEIIKIYNKYAEYPKVHEFDKKFFRSKALIYEGKNFSPKVKLKSPLECEIRHFLKCTNNKIIPKTDFNFAFKIMKFLKGI